MQVVTDREAGERPCLGWPPLEGERLQKLEILVIDRIDIQGNFLDHHGPEILDIGDSMTPRQYLPVITGR